MVLRSAISVDGVGACCASAACELPGSRAWALFGTMSRCAGETAPSWKKPAVCCRSIEARWLTSWTRTGTAGSRMRLRPRRTTVACQQSLTGVAFHRTGCARRTRERPRLALWAGPGVRELSRRLTISPPRVDPTAPDRQSPAGRVRNHVRSRGEVLVARVRAAPTSSGQPRKATVSVSASRSVSCGSR